MFTASEMRDYLRNDVFSYLILFGVVLGFILGVVLLSRAGRNRKASHLLGLIILCFVISNFDFWGGYTRYTLIYPHLLEISWPFSFALGPLILLYFKASLRGKPGRWDILYLVPFFFLFLYSFAFYLKDVDYKFDVYVHARGIGLPTKEFGKRFPADPWGIRNIGNRLLIIYLLVFMALTLLEVRRSIRSGRIKPGHSNRYLTWLLTFYLAMTAGIVVFIILQIVSPAAENEYVFAIAYTLIIYFVGLRFLARPGLFRSSPMDT